MSNLFEQVEDGKVVLVNKGIYSESDLFTHGSELFARVKTGYVRLLAQELTTNGTMKWKSIEGVEFHTTFAGPRLGKEPKQEPEPKTKRKPTRSRKPKYYDLNGRQMSA